MENTHDYKDFSKISLEIAATEFQKQKSTQVLFPVKLHHIIERAAVEGYSHIISWQPHGRAFKIHDEELFLSKIIFKFFFIRKIANFMRQLGVYGFRKIMKKNSSDKGAYFHELFLRQRSDLCIGIVRVKNRTLVNHANEPDLSTYDQMSLPNSNNTQDNNKIRVVNCIPIPGASSPVSNEKDEYYRDQLANCSNYDPSNIMHYLPIPTPTPTIITSNQKIGIVSLPSSEDEATTRITSLNNTTKLVIRPIVRQEDVAVQQNPETVCKYRDFLHVAPEEVIGNMKQARQEVFPIKLHRLIEKSVSEGYTNIVSWQSHGRSFRIHDTQNFLMHVVNRVFAVTNIAFFVRQLGLYGFQKISQESNADCGTYFHELFLRGRPELCVAIVKRKKRSLINRNNEPDFSHYEPVPGDLDIPVTPSATKTLICPDSIISDTKGCTPNKDKTQPSKQASKSKKYLDNRDLTDKQVIGNFRSVRQLFPEKLYKLLTQSEEHGYGHIISWQPHGRAFKIHDEKAFFDQVVNQFFCVSSMTFFTKQLALYGFQKIVNFDNEDIGAYFHELFLRGRPGLTVAIQRQKKRALVDKSNEPKFAMYNAMPCTVSTTTVDDNVTNKFQQCVMNKPMVCDGEEANDIANTTKVNNDAESDNSHELMEIKNTNEKLNVAVALFQLKNQSPMTDI